MGENWDQRRGKEEKRSSNTQRGDAQEYLRPQGIFASKQATALKITTEH